MSSIPICASLQATGIEISNPTRDAICHALRSNNLSLRCLIQLLFASSVGDRRSRNSPASAYDVSRIPSNISPVEHRDVIAWNTESSSKSLDHDSARSMVQDFINGAISGIDFRSYLLSKGVPLSSELEQLIRSHEADNSGNFSSFIMALIRTGSWDEVAPTPSVMTFESKEMVDNRNLNRGRKNHNSVPDILSWSCDIFLEFVL